VHGDVSKAAEARGIIEAAIKNYGRLDILVNNLFRESRGARHIGLSHEATPAKTVIVGKFTASAAKSGSFNSTLKSRKPPAFISDSTSHGGRSSGAPCGMRHPSPAARAIRNNPAPTTTAPMARATRSPAGARRSTVMAAVTTAIARRSMTPITRRIAVRPAQQ
jgi:hypothetical protein